MLASLRMQDVAQKGCAGVCCGTELWGLCTVLTRVRSCWPSRVGVMQLNEVWRPCAVLELYGEKGA